MKKHHTIERYAGPLLLAGFGIWTILVQTVNVQPIGPQGTAVGLASCNGWFHQLTGVHWTLYTLTDWLGLVPIAICLFFGTMGLAQLIRRKSLWKVDVDILLLGVYYGVVILGYLFFEKIIGRSWWMVFWKHPIPLPPHCWC